MKSAYIYTKSAEPLRVREPTVSGRAALEADPGLCFAAPALEPAVVTPHLTELLDPLELRRAELLRHKPGRRALVGYTLARPEGALRVLGKVRAKGTDVKTHTLQTALWRRGFGGGSEDGLSVAEPLGVLEPFHMTLQRAVPRVSLETLLHPDAAPLMRRVAEAARKLHQTPTPLSRCHTVQDELTILRRQLGTVSDAQPRYGARLSRVLAACEGVAEGLPVAVPATSTPSSCSSTAGGSTCSTSTSARGDPALDLGNFVVHLREHALRVRGDADALWGLERALTEHYCALTGVSAGAVAAYTTLSLARHIAISQRLPARRHLTGRLLALTEARLGLSGQ